MRINWQCFDVISECLLHVQSTYQLLYVYFCKNPYVNTYYVKEKLNCSDEELKERITHLGTPYYDKLVFLKKNKDIIISSVERIVADFDIKRKKSVDNELIVILGLGTSTIYKSQAHNSIFCLDAITQIDDLHILIAHENSHWNRELSYGEGIYNNCLGQRLFTEGLACHASMIACPDHNIEDYCLVEKRVVGWVEDNWDQVYEYVKCNYSEKGNINVFFDKNNKDQIFKMMPNRTGYVVGFKLIELLMKRSDTPINESSNWEIMKNLA